MVENWGFLEKENVIIIKNLYKYFMNFFFFLRVYKKMKSTQVYFF